MDCTMMFVRKLSWTGPRRTRSNLIPRSTSSGDHAHAWGTGRRKPEGWEYSTSGIGGMSSTTTTREAVPARPHVFWTVRTTLYPPGRSEEHTSELQSHHDLVC